MESIDTKRFKTLSLSMIDTETLGRNICTDWIQSNDDRAEFLEKRQDYTDYWRNLNPESAKGPWDNASNFSIPMTLFYGKAIHARLWQLFSDPSFFGVKARKEAFADKEGVVKEFMQFITSSWANDKQGIKDVQDESLWENVFDGSGYLKLYWNKKVHRFMDVEPVATVVERVTFDPKNLTGVESNEVKYNERDIEKEELVETPHLKRILMEDIITPPGQGDPQTSDWVQHRVWMLPDELKQKAKEGKYDQDAVEKALQHTSAFPSDGSDDIKIQRAQLEGIEDQSAYFKKYHAIIEFYGKAYVKKKIEGEEDKDIDEEQHEVVIWVHQGSREVLGWTYLFRISPSGIRPIFKTDFIKFPDRTHGVGVGEVLFPINRAVNSVYNLRMDNGTLASTPMGFYRASAGLKPDKLKIEPGVFYPLDDPERDIKIMQMPYLAGFGNNEEDRLTGYAEKLLNISDLQIRGSSQNVGLFRTASGANSVQQESGIQLEIHFDRLARTWSKILKAMFVLCRERMPESLFYRVTGANGQPIFGKVNREDLKGDYDFDIEVDILGQSKSEAQQQATLLMQMLINPAFMQTGVVTPSNLYELARNYLIKNQIKRVDNYVTPPPGYQGQSVTPSERVFRIAINNFTDPPIESTVRLNDDHQAALAFYEGFKQSNHYGMLTNPEQIRALETLIQAHQQMLAAAQAGGNPNVTGMQIPREGMAPMEAGSTSQGTLGAPMGEINGPVV